jgi:hypothetical protein
MRSVWGILNEADARHVVSAAIRLNVAFLVKATHDSVILLYCMVLTNAVAETIGKGGDSLRLLLR